MRRVNSINCTSFSQDDDPRCYEWIWSRPISQTVAVVEPIEAGDIPIEENVIEIESIKSKR